MTTPPPTEARFEVTDEMLVTAMRAFEPLSSVLRYREKDKWHSCDMMAMRDAIRAVAPLISPIHVVAQTVPGWRAADWDEAKASGRILLLWKAAGLPDHVELGKWKASEQAWTNTYGKPFSGDPDAWAPLLPFVPAAPAEAAGEVVDVRPSTLPGMIAAIYGELDRDDCAWIDSVWAKMRGYTLPRDGTSTLAHSGQKISDERLPKVGATFPLWLLAAVKESLFCCTEDPDLDHAHRVLFAIDAALASRSHSPAEVAETEDQAHIRTALETLCDPALIQVGGVGITRLMALVNRMAGIAKTALQRLPASPTQSGGAGNG